jgi:hypothetical protein
MAHVQRKNGRPRPWIARYVAPNGKERSQSFTRKIDAERFLASMEADKSRGAWTDPALGKIQVGAWTDQWLESIRPTLKPKTSAGYESLLRSRILPELGRLHDCRASSLRRCGVDRSTTGERPQCKSNPPGSRRSRPSARCSGARWTDRAQSRGWSATPPPGAPRGSVP